MSDNDSQEEKPPAILTLDEFIRLRKEEQLRIARESEELLEPKKRLREAVRKRDLVTVLEILAEDLNRVAESVSFPVGVAILQIAKRVREFPETGLPLWLRRDIIGREEAVDMLAWHKTVRFAEMFRDRLEELKARFPEW